MCKWNSKQVLSPQFGNVGNLPPLQKNFVKSIYSIAILIKITQCHYVVLIFLQNGTTDFDETLHVACVWLPEESKTTVISGYSPV